MTTSSKLSRAAIGALLAAAGIAPVLRAQGSLGTQGFGYPGGQLSARAAAAGGSLADFDPNTPINPAALSMPIRGSVYLQYDPEFRTVTGRNGTASTLTARFPVISVTGRFGRATVGLSFSNLLDRSWTNIYADTEMIGGEATPSQVSAQSTGGISDARAAMSYQVSNKLFLGLGIHVFPGENRTILGRDFVDSLKLGSYTQASIFNFSGSAVSLGVLAFPLPHLNLGASARFGGDMKMRLGDSTIVGAGRVPNRWSVSLAYDGFGGSALAVRYGHDKWSDMRGLGSSSLTIADASELSAGAEVAGPKLSGLPIAVRFGFRDRDLPFALGAQKVSEQSLTGGLGIPFASGRAAADFSVARAHRTTAGQGETGWILSFGFSLRP